MFELPDLQLRRVKIPSDGPSNTICLFIAPGQAGDAALRAIAAEQNGGYLMNTCVVYQGDRSSGQDLANRHRLQGQFLLDSDGAISQRYGALLGPRFLVLTPKGAIAYTSDYGLQGQALKDSLRELKKVTDPRSQFSVSRGKGTGKK